MPVTQRTFSSLASFSRFLDQRVEVIVPVGKLMLGATARILSRKVKSLYGDKVFADLAPATPAQRVRLGYAPNRPLLRSGALLRDQVEMGVAENVAGAGTPEVINAYHEYGYVNARTGRPVPPRPVFKLALEESAPKIMAMIEANVGVQLGFGIVDVI